jgi:hypothetical protein
VSFSSLQQVSGNKKIKRTSVAVRYRLLFTLGTESPAEGWVSSREVLAIFQSCSRNDNGVVL